MCRLWSSGMCIVHFTYSVQCYANDMLNLVWGSKHVHTGAIELRIVCSHLSPVAVEGGWV
jgi:hypothetical protein